MGQVLKFRRNTTDMSLQDGSSGAQLQPGWLPAVADYEEGVAPGTVMDNLPVQISDSSHDNLAAEMQELAQMVAWAAEYRKHRGCQYPVWLYDQLVNETGGRRAFVRRIRVQPRSGYHEPTMAANHVDVVLEVERGAFWEATSRSKEWDDLQVGAGISRLWDYTGATAANADVAGDVPARVEAIGAYPYDTADEIGRVWMGVRSADKHGTLTNFVLVWELEDTDGESGAVDTVAIDVHDATASPGGAGHTCVSVTPAAENTWVKERTLALSDVTANPTDNFGQFLWLLRAKAGHASSVWEVQLRFGYTDMADADHVRGPVVEVSGTSWNMYEAGQAWIPLVDRRVSSSGSYVHGDWQVQVWARRTTATGSGVLYMDCLNPVPLDESYLIMKGITAAYTDINNYGQIVYRSEPGGRFAAYLASVVGGEAGHIRDIPLVNVSPGGLRFPPGDGRLVIAFARETTSDITDVLNVVAGGWYDSWLTLRGAE